MSICEDKPWTMELVKDDPQSREGKKETFSFRDVTIRNGIIYGKVYQDDQFVSDLRGTCSSLGYLGHMTFFFSPSSVDILLFGVGVQLPNQQPVFSGRYAAFEPIWQRQSEVVVKVDPGETGTGTGMQAQ